jgi:hypothetical protein
LTRLYNAGRFESYSSFCVPILWLRTKHDLLSQLPITFNLLRGLSKNLLREFLLTWNPFFAFKHLDQEHNYAITKASWTTTPTQLNPTTIPSLENLDPSTKFPLQPIIQNQYQNHPEIQSGFSLPLKYPFVKKVERPKFLFSKNLASPTHRDS